MSLTIIYIKTNISVKIFQLEFFSTEYESIDSDGTIEKSMNLSLLPLFIERDDNEIPATLYHIPVNHHGISDPKKLKDLIDFITADKFNTVKDLFHFHVYRTKKNDNKKTTDMLVKFNNITSLHYGKRSIELQKDEYNEVIRPFLDSILPLNMFKSKDFNLFGVHYEDLQKRLKRYISTVPKKNENAYDIQDNKYVQDIDFVKFDEIKTVQDYNKFVKVFQSKCPLRFGIVEGLHRTKALISSIFEGETITQYFLSSNNVIISSSSGSKSKQKTYDDLVKISDSYKSQKLKTFPKTSLDNLRDLTGKMNNFYTPQYTIIEQLIQAQNNNNKEVTPNMLYSAEKDIMNVIRKFMIEVANGDKALSSSWNNTIKKEPKNALSYILNRSTFDSPKKIKNIFKNLPTFFTMKEQNSNYCSSSFVKMYQLEHINKAGEFYSKYHGKNNDSTYLFSELTLCQIFLRASTDSAFQNLLSSCIDFEVDEVIHTVKQLEIDNNGRECMDLDVLSK